MKVGFPLTITMPGDQPNALIQASDGNFYGAAQLTVIGSSNPQGGTLFKITPSGKFTLLFTFKADGHGNYLNGNNPASGLVEGNDGFIYGTDVSRRRCHGNRALSRVYAAFPRLNA